MGTPIMTLASGARRRRNETPGRRHFSEEARWRLASVRRQAAAQTPAPVLPVVVSGGGATVTPDPARGRLSININGSNRIVSYGSFELGSPTSSSETLTFLNSGKEGNFSVLNRCSAGRDRRSMDRL
jgi:hypothetical protein